MFQSVSPAIIWVYDRPAPAVFDRRMVVGMDDSERRERKADVKDAVREVLIDLFEIEPREIPQLRSFVQDGIRARERAQERRDYASRSIFEAVVSKLINVALGALSSAAIIQLIFHGKLPL